MTSNRDEHVASLFDRSRFKKKLSELLSRAVDEQSFLTLVWATRALQTDRVELARAYLTEFPAEAATSSIADKFALRAWDLETLVNLYLTTTKVEIIPNHRNRVLNTKVWSSIATAVRLLRKLESAEYGVMKRKFGVLIELHRISHRQFPWQRGFKNIPQFYRHSFVYGQGSSAEYFESQYGLPISQFVLVGFALFAAFQNHAAVKRNIEMQEFGLTPDIVENALRLISRSVHEARAAAAANAEKHRSLPIAYRPSVLRDSPILSFGLHEETLCAPLNELLINRVTSGLFYDLLPSGTTTMNQARARFEQYCIQLFKRNMPAFATEGEITYRFKGSENRTTDIFLRKEGQICLAIECKATKLTLAAQFSQDPVAEAKSSYDQIAKGIAQIWKFVGHARRRLVDVGPVAQRIFGMLITLDAWTLMVDDVRDQIIRDARSISTRDEGVSEEDRIEVIICSISEVESVLAEATEDMLLKTLAVTADSKRGWLLHSVFDDEFPADVRMDKKYPFDLREFLPWWRFAVDQCDGGNSVD